jgi:catechol 2,3-dioxygenase-like lactoylglutathione lyase family enzyme
MVANRVLLLEAKKISEVRFLNLEEIKEYRTEQGVEFFPLRNLDPNPVLTGSDLFIYEENCRLKGRFKMNVKCREDIRGRFNPGVNYVKFLFDNRASGDEAFAFVEFEGVDFVDIEDPDFLDETKTACSINLRFVLGGFQDAEKFFGASDEMVNWLKGFGVNLCLYQKKV